MWRLAARITAPTLVIAGRQDQLVDVRVAPQVARLVPDSRLMMLRGRRSRRADGGAAHRGPGGARPAGRAAGLRPGQVATQVRDGCGSARRRCAWQADQSMASRLSSDRRRLPVPLPSDPRQAREVVRAEQRRRHEQLRRRRHVVIGVMLAAFVIAAAGLGRQLFFAGLGRGAGDGRRDPRAGADARPDRAGPRASRPRPGRPAPPARSPTRAAPGTVAGAAGAVKKYRIAVENGSGQQADAFAAAVEQVFADPRGWTATGQLRLQRVAGQGTADFTIFLATPVTSEQICATAGCTPPATARAGSPARSSSIWRAG